MRLTAWLNRMVKCLLLLGSIGSAIAQPGAITLERAQQLARENYPLIKQKALLSQTASLNIANISKGYLPQLVINGQASYQSDVTRVDVPIPNIKIDAPEKDQYKIYAEASQLLYDGGQIKTQKQIQDFTKRADDQQLEVDLYKVRQRINTIYVGILYFDQQLKQMNLIRQDIMTGIKKTEAQVNNGVAFRSNLNVLKAELLKTTQREQEIEGSRVGLVNTLSVFINQQLDSAVVLAIPVNVNTAHANDLNATDVNTSESTGDALINESTRTNSQKQLSGKDSVLQSSQHIGSNSKRRSSTDIGNISRRQSSPDFGNISRPELRQFAERSALLGLQQQLVTARNRPKASLFIQGGYGRPALNLLKNEFEFYYIGGVRLNWNLGSLYTANRERQLITVNQRSIGLQQEAFLLNTKAELAGQLAEITKLQKMIETDAEIIALREQVRAASKAQLENGVITASDYLREINAADQAQQSRITHEIQLLQAQINYQNISGNY
jgi:outer membrane protein TolC